MENIKNNYSDLLGCYQLASEHYLSTGSTRLLKFALEELNNFERSFIRSYSVEQLQELQYSLLAVH